MKLTVRPRHPKWVVSSVYVGKKKAFLGMHYPTRLTFYNKKLATRMASFLNNKVKHLERWPAKDFEFQVIPNQRPIP